MGRWRFHLAILTLALTYILAHGGPSHPLRLDDKVVPTFEAIRLTLDADRADYTGSVRIDLQVREATRSFRFHAERMTLDRILLKGAGGEIGLAHERGDQGTVTATAGAPIAPGSYTLEIDFTNSFGTQAVGLYRMEQDGQGYAFTQLESDDAREAFPCWDEPIFKIPFQVTVSVPEGHIALSNTPAEKETVEQGWRTYTFARTRPLPTYLLAVAAGPLETVPMAGLDIPGSVVSVKGRKHLAGTAIELTPKILSALEEYFGGKYPYEKLDFIAIPDYWPGAMENPGAITFAEPLLMLDPSSVSVSQRRTLARVIAHELAHMWFGDVVTMAWWDDLWLNEAFADWMGDKITEQVHPEFELGLTELQSIQANMMADARPSAQPVRRPVNPGDNLLENVGAVYDKGKSTLGMFERWIGEETFQKGVRDYLEANAWGNATSDDLWSALSTAAGRDVSAAMITFLVQPGVPLVSVEFAEDGKVKLSQRRFLNHGVSAPDQIWSIPVTLKFSDGNGVRSKSILLDRESQVVDLAVVGELGWLLPDADARGYYWWSVPPGMLMEMARQSAAQLDARERVGFIGNLSALLNSGEVSGDAYLKALSYFSNDPEPMVVSALVNALEDVRRVFVPAGLQQAFSAYVRATLGPAMERFGMSVRPGEDEAVSIVRSQILGMLGDEGNDPEAQAFAAEQARRYMADPASVDPSLADVVLQLAAINGDRKLMQEYRRRLERASVPTERSRYLSASGSFRNPELMRDALTYALEGPLRPREIFQGLRALGETPQGRDLRFQWLIDNYDSIASKFPEQFHGFLVHLAGGCEPERLESARRFFSQPEHQGPGTLSSLAKVTDQVKDCADLRDREGDTVARFLESFAKTPSTSGS